MSTYQADCPNCVTTFSGDDKEQVLGDLREHRNRVHRIPVAALEGDAQFVREV
jgi:hypothetical protein